MAALILSGIAFSYMAIKPNNLVEGAIALAGATLGVILAVRR